MIEQTGGLEKDLKKLEEKVEAMQFALAHSDGLSDVTELMEAYSNLRILQTGSGLRTSERAKEVLLKLKISHLSKPGRAEKTVTALLLVGTLGYATLEAKLTYDSLQMLVTSARNIGMVGEGANITNALPKLQQVLREFRHIGDYSWAAGGHALGTAVGAGAAYFIDRFQPVTKFRKLVTFIPHITNR